MGLERRQFTELLPRLIRRPGLLVKDPDVMADAIPMIGFLVPLLHVFLIPGILYAQYTQKHTPKHERNLLVGQEFLNHLIGAGIHILMFMSGGLLARKFIINRNPAKFPIGSRAQKDAETMACMIGAFIGGTFVMPALSATVIEKYVKKPVTPTPVIKSNAITRMSSPGGVQNNPLFAQTPRVMNRSYQTLPI